MDVEVRLAGVKAIDEGGSSSIDRATLQNNCTEVSVHTLPVSAPKILVSVAAMNPVKSLDMDNHLCLGN